MSFIKVLVLNGDLIVALAAVQGAEYFRFDYRIDTIVHSWCLLDVFYGDEV